MKLPLENVLRAGLGLVVVALLGLSLKPVIGASAQVEPSLDALIASASFPGDPRLTDYAQSVGWLSYDTFLAASPTSPQPQLLTVVLASLNGRGNGPVNGNGNASRRSNPSSTAPGESTTTTVGQVASTDVPASTTTPSTTNTTTATPPTTQPPTPTTQPKTTANHSSYPGRPSSGKVYWGATVGSNTDPSARHEGPAGVPLSLRRTFFQWKHRTGYMIDTARGDISKGRLPWVSIKTPSWQEMAAGSHDAEIDEMLQALDGVQGPVWLTIHHEPEGGGGVNKPDDPAGPAGHLAMNRRVRQRMIALGVDNVALGPILMDWTWESSSGRNPNEWWDGSVYDFIGVDHYVCYSGSASCEHDSLLNSTWTKVKNWAEAKGVDIAVGEWGMRGTDEDARTRLRAWFDSAASSGGGGGRVVALAAFDSDQNVPSSYFLSGTQLDEFQRLLKDSRTARIR